MSIYNENENIISNDSKIESSKKFLLKLKQDNMNGQIELKRKISINNVEAYKIKEAIDTFEINQDTSAEIFSPIENKNTNFIYSLKEQLIRLQVELNHDELKLSDLLNESRAIDEIINQLSKSNDTIYMDSCFESEMFSKANQYNGLGAMILENQELDRKRIASDLHDSTVQNLTSLVHKTDLCTKLVDLDPIRVKLELQSMIGTLRSTINGMRTIIFDLRPILIKDLGLVTAIEQYISNLNNNRNIPFDFQVVNTEIIVLPIINMTIFRILQESCLNIIKHSKASSVDITLQYNDKDIELTIHDNGIGFSMDKVRAKNKLCLSNFGLSIMKERVILLSGKLEIQSKEGQGTKIYAKIPYNAFRGEQDGTY